MNTREIVFNVALRPASKTFQPTPYKLAEVVTHRDGDEYTAESTPKPYNSQLFDPWRRGDLVVVERITRSHYVKGSPTVSSTWLIGRRFTTPCAKRQQINSCYRVEPGKDAKLWRIVLRYHAAAEKLINHEFATRAELEAALDNPESVQMLEAAE